MISSVLTDKFISFDLSRNSSKAWASTKPIFLLVLNAPRASKSLCLCAISSASCIVINLELHFFNPKLCIHSWPLWGTFLVWKLDIVEIFLIFNFLLKIDGDIKLIKVETAEQMFKETQKNYPR